VIDFKNAKRVFAEFVKDYDAENPKVALKITHTYKTLEVAEQVATNLGLNEEDINIAKLIGLLHDIGRFPQVAKYNSFVDNREKGICHAKMGVEYLFDQGHIRDFIADNKYDNLIKTAIHNHNKLAIEDGLDNHTLLHCKIIRDADKLDIFRFIFERDPSELLPPDIEEIEGLSPEVYLALKSCLPFDFKLRKTPIDFWIAHISYVFDINFPYSLKIIRQNDIVNRLIDRFRQTTPKTIAQLEEIRTAVNNYLTLRTSHSVLDTEAQIAES
jgi:putative nucleotidyltransferase with HDIG domain